MLFFHMQGSNYVWTITDCSKLGFYGRDSAGTGRIAISGYIQVRSGSVRVQDQGFVAIYQQSTQLRNRGIRHLFYQEFVRRRDERCRFQCG